MPLVLAQRFLDGEGGQEYEDVEGSLYHYPSVYFGRMTPYAQFVYYRPLGKRAPRHDSKTYFGHGTVGMPYADVRDPSKRFVDIVQYQTFPRLVGMRDPLGIVYETGTQAGFQAQAAVRAISDIAYHRILAAAGVAVTGLAGIARTTDAVRLPFAPRGVSPLIAPPPGAAWPKQPFRLITEIPRGAGYVPSGGAAPDVHESAALQGRARADHQGVLARIAANVHARGGETLYNNNIDLLVRLGGERVLVEAKSLVDDRDAVDRMRYGMGQLMDYGVRYRAELAGAKPLLAFGNPPDRQTGWIADVLAENAIAFACLDGGEVKPFNDRARALTLFSA